MAEESVLFELDFGDSLEKLAELRDQITAYKAQQKLLAEEIKNGNASAGKAYEELGVTVRGLQAEQRGLQRTVDGYTRSNKQALDTVNLSNNSIKQNRELLKQLKEQYIGLKNPTEAQTAAIKNLTNTLIQQESKIGVTARNVGNYGSRLNDLKSGIKGAITGQLGLNASMLANPVTGLIAAFKLLTSAFSSNADIATELQAITAGINAAFRVLIDTIVSLLPDFGKLFKDPKQAALDFVEFIKNQFIKRIESIGVAFAGLKKILKGDFEEGLKDVGNAFIQFNTGIENGIDKLKEFGSAVTEAASAGRQASLELDRLTVANQKLDNEIRKNEQSIKALTFQLKDRTKSEKERIKIAETIAALEVKNADIQVQKSKELLAAERLRLKDKVLSADEQAKLSKLQTDIEIAESEKRIANSQRETRINILLEREAKKEQIEDNSAYLQALAKLQDEFTLNERQKLEKSFQDKIALIQGQSAEEIELRKIIAEKQAEALAEFDQQILEKAIKQDAANQLARLEAELLRLDELSPQRLEKEIELELARRDALLLNDKLTAEQKELIIEQSRQKQLGIFKKYDEKEIAQAQAAAQAKLLIANLLQQGLSDILEAFGNDSEEAAAFQKLLGLFQIGIDTATAISAATSVAQSPTADNIASGGLAGIAKAIALTTSILSNIGKAKKLIAGNPPKAPKFADGGAIDIGGKSHAAGGEMVTVGGRPVAEVEGGEGLFVMKKTAYGALKKLSSFNKKFGGRSWLSGRVGHAAQGGFIGDGGFAQRQFSQQSDLALLTQTIIAETLARAPQPTLIISELEAVQSDRGRAIEVSEL